MADCYLFPGEATIPFDHLKRDGERVRFWYTEHEHATMIAYCHTRCREAKVEGAKGRPKFKCPYCGAVKVDKSRLNRHIVDGTAACMARPKGTKPFPDAELKHAMAVENVMNSVPASSVDAYHAWILQNRVALGEIADPIEVPAVVPSSAISATEVPSSSAPAVSVPGPSIRQVSNERDKRRLSPPLPVPIAKKINIANRGNRSSRFILRKRTPGSILLLPHGLIPQFPFPNVNEKGFWPAFQEFVARGEGAVHATAAKSSWVLSTDNQVGFPAISLFFKFWAVVYPCNPLCYPPCLSCGV